MSFDILLPALALVGSIVSWLYLKYKKRQDESSKASPKSASQSSKLQRKTQPTDSADLSTALMLELSAAVLRAGQSLGGMTFELSRLTSTDTSDVLLEVSRGLSHGLPWQAAWQHAEHVADGRTPPSIVPLRDCLESLADQGAPTADLLDIVAERHRRIEQRQAEKAAAKLSVKLVVPLGLCSLPAFICWGVVPVMIALLPGIAGSL